MEHYESKPAAVKRTAAEVYAIFSRMDALTPMVADKTEGWQADADSCSFRAQGFPVALRIAERVENSLIRVESEGATPLKFSFSLLLAQAEQGSEVQVALDIDLNVMMKMMLGGKLQEAVDKIAETVCMALNA